MRYGGELSLKHACSVLSGRPSLTSCLVAAIWGPSWFAKTPYRCGALDSVQFQPREELVIMEAVLKKLTVTLNEIFEEIYRSTGSAEFALSSIHFEEIYRSTGSEFALSSIHYYLKRNVITRIKVINVPELDCLIN